MDYDNILSGKVQSIKPSGIRRFFDLAESMSDCISLGVGEPDFQTPERIREKGVQMLRRGATKYTANAGLAELRKAISEYMSGRFGVKYDPQTEITVTVGGSEGIDVAIRACVNPGDEVLVPEPCFVCYAPLAEMAGATPVHVALREEDEFILTPEILRKYITPRTKLLILPFPNNPTGALMTEEDYKAIAEVLRGTDIMVLTDEIYAELCYTGKAPVSFAQIDGMRERTIVVNGFSKAYAMTGWRMGYLCAPEPVMKQMLKLHQYQIMSAPTVSQWAAIEAIRYCADDVERMRREYDERRKYLLGALRGMGFPCFEPRGAFYMFPNISGCDLSSEEICQRFLNKYKVAVIPGTAFGDSGEGFVRISYAYSMEHLKRAMELMGRFADDLRRG